jgi:hypothetical protein
MGIIGKYIGWKCWLEKRLIMKLVRGFLIKLWMPVESF